MPAMRAHLAVSASQSRTFCARREARPGRDEPCLGLTAVNVLLDDESGFRPRGGKFTTRKLSQELRSLASR